MKRKVLFSIHDYDRDGDIDERGIYLHFGKTRIHVAENMPEFEEVVSQIMGMVDEIKENYPASELE